MYAAPYYERYSSMFEGLVADTPSLKRECFKLRHQVYCRETGYEPVSSNRIECDHYDGASVHALLRHRESGAFAGTVRLILRRRLEGNLLPTHKLCRQHGIMMPRYCQNDNLAEVSRLAITKDFRQQQMSKADRAAIASGMAIGLLVMVNQLAEDNDVTAYCAVLEPALLRLMGRSGIRFTPSGPVIDYHGRRQICHSPVDRVRNDVQRAAPDLMNFLDQQGPFKHAAACCGRAYRETRAATEDDAGSADGPPVKRPSARRSRFSRFHLS